LYEIGSLIFLPARAVVAKKNVLLIMGTAGEFEVMAGAFY